MTTETNVETTEDTTLWSLLGWVIFAVSAAVLAIAVMLGFVMRAVVLDVVSFWPAWVLAGVIALAVWPLQRRGIARVSAIAPLLLFSWLTGAVALHYVGWDQLPSAAGDLTGPGVGDAVTAELTIDLVGDVVLVPGSRFLYEVKLARSGGSTGPAEALELSTGSDVVVTLMERSDAGWFEASGWEVTIARTPAWSLSVAATSVDLDLATVSIESLEVVADGRVKLASPVGDVPVLVSGAVEVEVPASANVEIFGAADVPDSWTATETGFSFEGEGTSTYLITVADGASLIVTQW